LGLTFDPSTVPAINTVLVSTQDYALLINRDKGDLVRKVKFGFAASTPVVSDGSSLFVGAGTGWFYDIRLTDGVQKWAMATGGMITARPEFYARRLYVGSYDNTFRAIDPYIEGQRTVWGQKTAGPISADFSVSSRGCFVSSRDASVYNYDPATGREVWSYRTQKPLVNAAQIGERTVFQYAEGDAFYAIDLATGRLRWPGSPELRTVVGASGRNVYASTRHGLLVTVDEMTGKISSTVMAYGLKLLAPNTDKDAIFAATPSGYFFCIRPKGAAPLTAEALKPVLPKG
jgi:outer membrane protein assembly factor BamB